MARHQKSLLEAFQSANDERAGGDPASAGPFAGTPTSDLRSAEPRHLLPAVSARDTRVILTFAGSCLLTFVIGVLLGRQFGTSESQAAEGGESLSTLLADGAPIWEGSESLTREEIDAALLDKANRYTVLAYSCEAVDEADAWENYYNLIERGLPVATYGTNDKIYVLVGAATESEDLASLQAYLHTLGGPGGVSYAYSEAFTLLIDNIVDRD